MPLSSVSSEDSPWIQHSPCWLINPLFPRSVPLFQHLSSFTKEENITRNGLVEDHLLNNKDTILPLIGIVALEWSDWFPALAFLPLSSLWVWILDPRWKVICIRLFPDCKFIDGFITFLPAMDILLFSRVSLSMCLIKLSTVTFSLLLTTASNIFRRCWKPARDIGWKTSFWHLPHSQVCGGTTGLYTLSLLSRISYYKPPSLYFFPQLSSGNVGRVVDEKYSCDITSDTSALNDASTHLTSSDLFPVASPATLFKVKYIFTSMRL